MPAKKKTTKKQNSSTKTITKPVPPKTELYPLSSKKPETKKQRPFHAVGVLKTESESQTPPYHEGIYSQFTPDQIKSHIPQYTVVPYSHGENPRPLSAKQITIQRQKKNSPFPKFFMNPYQDLDYMVLEDIYTNRNTRFDRILDSYFLISE